MGRAEKCASQSMIGEKREKGPICEVVIVPEALIVRSRVMRNEKCWEKESECSSHEVFEKYGCNVTNGKDSEWRGA